MASLQLGVTQTTQTTRGEVKPATSKFARVGGALQDSHIVFNPYSHLAYLRTEIDCFNGPWGYRAQYWINPFTDLAANAAILDALKPKLLECVDINALPDLAKIN